MNILFVSSSYPRHEDDHSGHFVRAEAQALRAAGHQVRIICPGGVPDSEPPSTLGPHLRLGGTALFSSPGAWPNLKQSPTALVHLLMASVSMARQSPRLRRGPPIDQIVAHWLFPGALPWAFLLGLSHVPLHVVVHGTDLRLICRLPRPLQRSLLQLLVRRGATLQFVSQELKNTLLNQATDPLIRSWVADSVVRPARIELDAVPSREEARLSLNIQPSARVILIVGRLIDSKRLVTALSSALLVPDAQLYVIGEGPLEVALRREFTGAQFLGPLPRSRVLLWMRAADLLLSASRLEGAPTTIREALMLGTSVVSPGVADLKVWQTDHPGLWCVD